MGEVKRIKKILEELPCTKAQHQCQSEGVNGKAWEECGAMPGGEACVTFLDVRNFSLIAFLSASRHSLVCLPSSLSGSLQIDPFALLCVFLIFLCKIATLWAHLVN